jgi:adenosine deaminase
MMNINHDIRFIAGLEQQNRSVVQSVPKSDLHCHAGLGFKLEVMERWAERKINPAPPLMPVLDAMNVWIVAELGALYQEKKTVEFAVRAALAEAWNDGITLLEMSIDLSFISHYQNDPEKFGRMVLDAHRVVAPEILFRPELGIARDADPAKLIPLAMKCIDTGLFRCIDLYGNEAAQPPEVYETLYDHARKAGLKCKVHAGEFGDAASMLHTAKVLGPESIQHGIAAAKSDELIRFLIDSRITLNICPTSNIRLSRVPDYRSHPIRTLFEAGVSVTINSDDIMVFGQNVTDEYLHLFHAGVLSAEALNQIRVNGLSDE